MAWQIRIALLAAAVLTIADRAPPAAAWTNTVADVQRAPLLEIDPPIYFPGYIPTEAQDPLPKNDVASPLVGPTSPSPVAEAGDPSAPEPAGMAAEIANAKVIRPGQSSVEAAIRAVFADEGAQGVSDALTIARCESTLGADPATWDVDAINGGPFQINRPTWQRFFEAMGVPWPTVVLDPAVNAWAARIVRDRSGGWAFAWVHCAASLSR